MLARKNTITNNFVVNFGAGLWQFCLQICFNLKKCKFNTTYCKRLLHLKRVQGRLYLYDIELFNTFRYFRLPQTVLDGSQDFIRLQN